MTHTPADDDLAGAAQEQCRVWGLRQDGAARDGAVALTLPVRTSEGAAAVLKVSSPTAGSGQAHLALRRWGGDGAVRLLRADPHRHAVLLERLRPRTLDDLPDAAACEVVAGLYRRLHVAPLPQVPSFTTVVAQWARQVDERPRNAALPRRLIEQAVASTRELAVETATTDVLLHGDLHHGSVLAADREPWLAISPRPVNGDRHAELAPMLLHRLDDLGGRLRDGIRARFYALVDAAGLDEDLARAWTFIRVVHAATRAIDDSADLTRYVAIAKALQD